VNTEYIVRLSVSLLPVVLFLVTLVYIDTYKLVRFRFIAQTMAAGCLAALACVVINGSLMNIFEIPDWTFRKYGAPPVEEVAKAVFVVWLIARGKVGFMVDAAILGFAVGAGFAIVENTWYVGTLETDNVAVWAVRGFGTAVMHGGMTSIFAILSKNLFDRTKGNNLAVYLPGLLLATIVHSMYNHFILGPIAETVVLYLTLPLLMLFVFYRSERSTRHWLGEQMDVDAQLLDMINTGRILETPIGRFFDTMRTRFPAEMVLDMLCYLRLHVELAICAKGLLMMREAGFEMDPPPETAEHFKELHHLQKAIGRTGRLAVMPFLHSSRRDAWQLHMLEKMVD